MRILVCGGRNYYKYSVVKDTLENMLTDIWCKSPEEIVTIIQGEATGADFLAKVFALDEYQSNPRVLSEGYPADWGTYGKSAGSIRNKQMLEIGKPDIVLAFPGGRGTEDMVRQATKANVRVIRIG